LLALVVRASNPSLAVLGRVPGGDDFTDIHRHPDNTTVPGLLMVRPENGLFFANAAGFRDAILLQIRASQEPITTLVIDLGATTDLDVPSADMLRELYEELEGEEIRLMLVRVIASVREFLSRAGVVEAIGEDNIFVGPRDAVAAHNQSTNTRT
jgi:MFS superfamily sulfate permease-like transporter